MNRLSLRSALLLLLFVILLVPGVVWGPEFWWRLRHEKQKTRGNGVSGYIWVRRSDNTGRESLMWYESTGFAACDEEPLHRGGLLTTYGMDGAVVYQTKPLPGGTWETKKAPPWWGERHDQKNPSAPWIEAGLTPEAWSKRP